MPKDGLRPLPDDIVAPLLRALVTIRPAPEARLYLGRAERGRPPDWDASTDYNVMFRDRQGKPVESIELDDKTARKVPKR